MRNFAVNITCLLLLCAPASRVGGHIKPSPSQCDGGGKGRRTLDPKRANDSLP